MIIQRKYAMVGVVLIIMYAVFIFSVFSWYEFESSRTAFISSLRYMLELAVFLVICCYFKGMKMWVAGLVAVAVMSVSSGLIHFYFSEIYGGFDWPGIHGAFTGMKVSAAISLYIFLLAAAVAWLSRYLMKRISSLRHRL